MARSITRTGSKQTYYTGRLMVDKDLVDDFCRAYAYFRWTDDMVDVPTPVDLYPSKDVSDRSTDECINFIKRQRTLIDRLYENESLGELTPEEEILAGLINHDRGENSGLQSFIRNMFAIIEFDAYRKGRLINDGELTWYSENLAKSVTDGLLYFVGNGHPHPDTEEQYLAAYAAHITHLLRDMLPDIADGFINIPVEYLEAHGISPQDVDNPAYKAWVRGRVELAREYFFEGKRYLDELDVLRTKIVGYWYCARFEDVLDAIENDGYLLRAEYEERPKICSWLKMSWLGFTIAVRHILDMFL